MSIPPPPPDSQPPYGGNPPPPGPYPQWNWPPPQPPRRPSVNGFAVAALVLGILCLVPLLGLVLGVVALVQIRRSGERGKGMAIAGVVLSSVGMVLWVTLMVTDGLSSFLDDFAAGVHESNTLYVETGTCFNTPGGPSGEVTYDLDEVPCEDRHEGEVFATFELPDGDFPGDARIEETADERCYALQSSYAMDSWALPENVDVYYLVPIRSSWRLGDREVACFFGHVDTGSRLTGSLRNDGTNLDQHQMAFLRAEQLLNEALDSIPEEEYVEDDLPGHQEWARRMEGALGEQITMLEAHTWPAAAADPVAALVKDLREAREAWDKAANTTDVDAYYVHMDKGFTLTDPARSVAPRTALGLATDPPYTYEEEGGPADGGSGSGGVDV
ncbi:DUF4190 domain-containing protein [Streptomyces sp. NPDC048290]|uniref:DUF4190 domain-containing protein n=1 Tax=Streptomyces sp. NPDC048290 TaxID=3155811 RepID=UPI0034441221